MVKSFAIIGLLLVTIALFEFLPAVEDARAYVSSENYENPETACQELLVDRPWYGIINYWFIA